VTPRHPDWILSEIRTIRMLHNTDFSGAQSLLAAEQVAAPHAPRADRR
jgi:hypothetical protein